MADGVEITSIPSFLLRFCLCWVLSLTFMAYLQSVVLAVLSVISAFSLAVGAVTHATLAQTNPQTTPVTPSVPVRRISPIKSQPAPPPWAWWVTIALIPAGTTLGVIYGRRSARSPLQTPPTLQAHPSNTASTPTQTASPASPHAERTSLETTQPAQTTRLSKGDGVENLLANLHHPDPIQRHKVIWELGQRGDSRAVQPLVELISTSDSLQRSLILAAVSEISIRTLQPMHRALLISLQDDSADVRKNAIRDATRLYDLISPIRPMLQFAIDDGDAEVRETADWALKQLNRMHLIPSLTESSLPPSQDNPPSLPPSVEQPDEQDKPDETSSAPA